MLRKLALLAVAVTGFVVASTLVPLETQAAGREWNRQVQVQHDGRHGTQFTVVTQPPHQVYVRPYYPHHHYHHGYVFEAPVQPVWVPAGWYWTGYQWVWVSGYWR